MNAASAAALAIVAGCALSRSVPGQGSVAPSSNAPVLRVTVPVDFGRDLGQNFGTLFEATDPQGRVLAGAGFQGLYNTTCRNDRRSLQFYVRPTQDASRPATEALPRFSKDTGVYIGDINGRMYALGRRVSGRVLAWNAATGQWEIAPEYGDVPLQHGDGEMHLGAGRLTFRKGRVEYNGELVLAAPQGESIHHIYYAMGHLFFYHDRPGEAKDGAFTRVCALPWTPGQPRPDLAKAVAHPTATLHETTWAWGQVAGKVMTVTNWGGAIAFDGKAWQTMRERDGKSYQVYSMLTYYDRLLLGHYPSGCLFEYDGEQLKVTENQPPRIPGVASWAREAQAMALYRGDLYATVWPWAELWRFDRNAGRWSAVGRMFSRPPVTDKFGHPFEEEITAYNAAHGAKYVVNEWGQRATSLAVAGDTLYIGTSNKSELPRPPEYAFIDDAMLSEYGHVRRLKLPGHLSAQVRWVDGPTTFTFEIGGGRMTILQDNRELAAVALDPALCGEVASGAKDLKFTWGSGLYGPLAGKLAACGVAGGAR